MGRQKLIFTKAFFFFSLETPAPLATHFFHGRLESMVVKTEKCAFSEYHIFPGHGMKYIRRDGQPIILSGSKAKSLYLQRMKSSKLMWTQAWRRLNKKGNDATIARKKTKRSVKMQRAIVGISLETVSFSSYFLASPFVNWMVGLTWRKSCR